MKIYSKLLKCQIGKLKLSTENFVKLTLSENLVLIQIYESLRDMKETSKELDQNFLEWKRGNIEEEDKKDTENEVHMTIIETDNEVLRDDYKYDILVTKLVKGENPKEPITKDNTTTLDEFMKEYDGSLDILQDSLSLWDDNEVDVFPNLISESKSHKEDNSEVSSVFDTKNNENAPEKLFRQMSETEEFCKSREENKIGPEVGQDIASHCNCADLLGYSVDGYTENDEKSDSLDKTHALKSAKEPPDQETDKDEPVNVKYVKENSLVDNNSLDEECSDKKIADLANLKGK